MCLTQSFNTALALMSFLFQTKFKDPTTRRSQAIVTVLINPSLSFQNGLNQNGMGPRSSSSSIYNKIDLWSEVILGKILEEMTFLADNIELCTKKWSSLAEMLVAPNLLFDHVNLPLFGLKSISSNDKIKLSTSFSKGSLP